MEEHTVARAVLVIGPKGPADRTQHAKVLDRVLQLDGDAVARELPAAHQLIVDGWGHLSYMPYLVHLEDKKRLLLLYNSRESQLLASNPHPVLLRSDDYGQSWRPQDIKDARGVPYPLQAGLGLAYLGEGRLTMDAAESGGRRLFSRDYGDTWQAVPIPKAANGFAWYRWDPCIADLDPLTGDLKRLLDTGYSEGMERRFERAKRVVVFPEEWYWRHDPEDRGLAEGWHRERALAQWPRRLRIDAHWTLQGEPDGIGWYGTCFALPDTAGAPLAIVFGAVDGTCDVFIDGIHVGEQKQPPEIMWNQPFHIPLNGGLAAGDHTLVIRVQKTCGPESNAGIYLPVWIVERPGASAGEEDVPWLRSHVRLRFSFDGGRTWPEEIEPPSWNGASGVGANEVALCRVANHDLLAACRITHPRYYSSHDNARIDHSCGLGVSLSSDDGYTWTPIQVLYEYGRMHPSMAVLPDGTVVMTYVVRRGALREEEHRLQDADGFPVWGVEAIVSRDHGRSWDLAHRYVLATWSGGSQAQSTSTVLLPDGSLLTAFGSGYLSPPGKVAMAPTHEVCLVRWRLAEASEGLQP